MLYLALAVLCSVLLGFIFKLYARFRVDSFQAIVFNYFTCVACGWAHLGRFPVTRADFSQPWMPYALGLGFVFITGFNGAALTVRYFSVTISQIMQKMSILLTVPFAILMYQESAGWGKILGFMAALACIILVNLPAKTSDPTLAPRKSGKWLWIPAITWILSGIIEMVFVFVQHENYIIPGDRPFICTVFGAAGILGMTVAVAGWSTGRLQFAWRHVVGGIVLGIPNYGSILFLLLALGSGLEGSLVFPLINVGVILTTTIGAVWLFQERLSQVNWIGVGLAIISIVLISL